MPQKTVDVILNQGGITVKPWVVDVDLRNPNNPDFVLWGAQGCRIKIETDHPEHFNARLEDKYKRNVKGDFDRNAVQSGTYKYCISILEDSSPPADAAVYRIDPDYKVDR